MTSFYLALPLSDLPEGENRAIELAGLSILLCNDAGQIYAIENRCSHLDEPLTCGRVRRGWIACPAHGARFDLETGEALGPPATSPIRTYPVEVQDGMIHVRA
jgi:3-phenylpropionate/trans-cinnamate dioxygenase ferredoxin component